MLNDSDIKKIGEVLDEKIEKRFEDFGKTVDDKLEKRFEDFGKTVDDKLEKRLKPIKSDIAEVRKDMKTIVNFFDNEYLELRERVERIEAHLKLSVS